MTQNQPAFYRAAQLASTPTKAGLLPFSNPTLWRLVREGKFPQPVKLASHITAWKAADVHQWIEARQGNA